MPNPFAHIELQTDDVAKAKKFYKSLFDWKFKDVPDMSYTMLDVGEGTGGGLTKHMMPGAPNAWLSYVQVDSVKKTVEKAKKAGGNALVEYMPIGDMGAIGVIADPSGATFGVWETAKPAPKAAKKKAAKKSAAKKPAAKKKAAKKKA
ncbi:MAG TPA: VOC family protein [Polyangiaceae bacterium]